LCVSALTNVHRERMLLTSSLVLHSTPFTSPDVER